MRGWMIAAGLVGVLGAAGALGALLLRSPATARDASTASSSDGAALDLIIALPSTCTRAGCRLGWRGAPGQEFRLRVLTEDLEILQDIDVAEATSFEVPAADLARVQPGDALLWQVSGQNAEGQTLRSTTYREELE